MTALDDERTEHSRQLSKVLREQAIDGERLTICEERWQLVAPLLKTWANGQSLQNQIVDRINDLTNRAEELKQSKEGGE
jgi:hypothetical protein